MSKHTLPRGTVIARSGLSFPLMNNARSPLILATLAIVALLIPYVSGQTRPAAPQARPGAPATPPWADWVEPDFPFFSSVVEVSQPQTPGRNLTPRALVLNLGRGQWAAFDTDLLRLAALWTGKAVTPKALAPGSYLVPDKKTPGGQSPAPEPDGRVWLVNGLYPGWQASARPSVEDPREPAPSAEEVGRGPLPEE